MPRMFQIIRLSRYGCANRPFVHFVLINNQARHDSPPIEQLGVYDNMPNVFNEKLVSLDVERINFHISRGVALSKRVETLLGLAGLLPVHPMSYITAKRNRKKLQAAAEAQAGDNKSEQQNQS